MVSALCNLLFQQFPFLYVQTLCVMTLNILNMCTLCFVHILIIFGGVLNFDMFTSTPPLEAYIVYFMSNL